MKRDKEIHLRMTDSELADFKEKLNASGMTQTDFVISAIIGAQIASKELTAEKHEQNKMLEHFLVQLRKIGTNVNQIARIANQTGEANVLGELQEYRTQLSELKEDLCRYTKSLIPPVAG